MYVLLKYKNDVYKIEQVSDTKNIKNFIKLNVKNNISKDIVIKILKYNINILNKNNNDTLLIINKYNDLILVKIPYFSFINFIYNLQL